MKFDAVNSYARCEGSTDELSYYFVRHLQCNNCKEIINLLKPTLQLKLLEYLVHYYPIIVQQRDCKTRHHDVISGEEVDKVICVSSRFG